MKSGIPFWLDEAPSTSYPPLAQDLAVDVAIVGGGMVGLHLAWRLSTIGLRVTLFEARRIGQQATGRSTAKVTSQNGLKYDSLIRNFGEDHALLYAQSNQLAVTNIADLARKMDGMAGLEQKSACVLATTVQETERLETECAAALSLGLPATIDRNARLPFHTEAQLTFAGQYQIDPYRYLVGLAGFVAGRVELFENSRVDNVRYGQPCALEVNGRTVTAGTVVLATQIPIVNDGMFYAKAFPMAHPILAAPKPEGLELDGMYISAGKPTHSFRTATKGGQEWLIVGGDEYRPGEPAQERQAVEDLLAWVASTFGIKTVSHLWTNEDFRPMDGAAFIGPVSSSQPNMLVATGFEAWGLSQGAVAADIIAARLLGQDHPAFKLFEASRVKPLAGGSTFVSENTKAAGHLVGDRVLKRKVVPLAKIKPGDGGVISHNGEQLAVIRTSEGSLQALSAICTHMGCVVGWNETDRTWDCPCHGSRFDEHGAVLTGPARSPLETRDASTLGRKTE